MAWPPAAWCQDRQGERRPRRDLIFPAASVAQGDGSRTSRRASAAFDSLIVYAPAPERRDPRAVDMARAIDDLARSSLASAVAAQARLIDLGDPVAQSVPESSVGQQA